ncbi:MAG: hypothetical protein HY664_08125 [Chloroflexi bacterium]|nr:hypothetical protein [Chloroflexota bacterium]
MYFNDKDMGGGFDTWLDNILFAQREKAELDRIAAERGLTKDERQRLGRAVERYKKEHGMLNRGKLPRKKIEGIADEEGLDNR